MINDSDLDNQIKDIFAFYFKIFIKIRNGDKKSFCFISHNIDATVAVPDNTIKCNGVQLFFWNLCVYL